MYTARIDLIIRLKKIYFCNLAAISRPLAQHLAFRIKKMRPMMSTIAVGIAINSAVDKLVSTNFVVSLSATAA